MKIRRYSPQREMIYECVKKSRQHPTAEMVYKQLKPGHPELSLGTVYRNLKVLAEDGMIARMNFQVERFDADLSPHAHFVCDACGAVYDICLPHDSELDRQAEKLIGGCVNRHTVVFRGLCKLCVEKQQKGE